VTNTPSDPFLTTVGSQPLTVGGSDSFHSGRWLATLRRQSGGYLCSPCPLAARPVPPCTWRPPSARGFGVPLIAEVGSFARITALVVDEKHRESGLGHRLLREAERIALSWGCSMLEVSTGNRPERVAAHALYSRTGFRDTAARSTRHWKVLARVQGNSRFET
jgi:GNAT superfamily N-acetyltransferase